jgi:hypothetical protein
LGSYILLGEYGVDGIDGGKLSLQDLKDLRMDKMLEWNMDGVLGRMLEWDMDGV